MMATLVERLFRYQDRIAAGRMSVVGRIIPFAALIMLIALFSALAPERFPTPVNVSFILQQASVVAIVAFGLSFVIMSGSIDLSVGSVMALAGVVSASLANEIDPTLAIAAGVATGGVAGLLNGIGTAVAKVPSFIVTLGMLSIARGATLLYTDSRPIAVFNSFEAIGHRGGIGYILAATFIGTYVLLNYTAFGRHTLAVGGEERVAFLSGVKIVQVKTLVFIFSGVMAGLGGVVLAARVGAATPTAATGFELTAIAAVVLGGTPLTGGIGSIAGVIVGTLIITILANGMVILGVPAEMQLVIQGLVLTIAVWISLDRRKIGAIK
jgi:ribose/xylose/arabinose/galactoside ABC-type transport system permease subunit